MAKTFHIYVNCVSLERFDVEANSREEAQEKYDLGECTLEADEVQEREIAKIISAEQEECLATGSAMTLNDALIRARKFLRTQPEARDQEHDAEWQLGALLEAVSAVVEEGKQPEQPFGGVTFDPLRRADDADKDESTNGERADLGKIALALTCYSPSEVIPLPVEHITTGLMARGINLIEAPEDALTDLLTNLMHYCHREGIEFSDAYLTASEHFKTESGGANI